MSLFQRQQMIESEMDNWVLFRNSISNPLRPYDSFR